jgi:hypothetical protein
MKITECKDLYKSELGLEIREEYVGERRVVGPAVIYPHSCKGGYLETKDGLRESLEPGKVVELEEGEEAILRSAGQGPGGLRVFIVEYRSRGIEELRE